MLALGLGTKSKIHIYFEIWREDRIMYPLKHTKNLICYSKL
jgi:hypothetical protein